MTNAACDMDAVALSDIKVFIAFRYENLRPYSLHGMMITIYGTTIDTAANRALATSYFNGGIISIARITTTTVLVLYRYQKDTSSSASLYNMVVNVGGSLPSAVTNTQLSASASDMHQVIQLSENNLLIMQNGGDTLCGNAYLSGVALLDTVYDTILGVAKTAVIGRYVDVYVPGLQ